VESGAKTCNTIAEIKGVNWVVRGTQKKTYQNYGEHL